MNNPLPIIGVMGSGSHDGGNRAVELGRWLAAKRVHLLTGGGAGSMATVSKAFAKPKAATAAKAKAEAPVCQVSFAKSGKKCGWTAGSENLLDFALANGVQIESGCRAGNCGTCVVAVKSGKVNYVTEFGAEIGEGSCLTCVAAPDGDIELDA